MRPIATAIACLSLCVSLRWSRPWSLQKLPSRSRRRLRVFGSFLHPDPTLSPLGSDLHKSFLKSILVPSAIVLLYSMVLTSTNKPTFLPWSLYIWLFVLLLAILYDHMIMYVGLFGHSAVVFHVIMFFLHVFMFYWPFMWLCFFQWHFLLIYPAV